MKHDPNCPKCNGTGTYTEGFHNSDREQVCDCVGQFLPCPVPFDETFDFIQNSLRRFQQGESVSDFHHYLSETALEDFAKIQGMDKKEFWKWFNQISEGLK